MSLPNPLAQIVTVRDGDATYEAIYLWCPGCEITDPDGHRHGGLHMLPITRDGGSGSAVPRPTWGWNGDLVNVGLEPSILTRTKRGPEQSEFVCHSFLRNGQWQFLGDCTHELANQTVSMVPLPDWAVRDAEDRNG